MTIATKNKQIDEAAEAYSTARSDLYNIARELEEEIQSFRDEVMDRYRPAIVRAAGVVRRKEATLSRLIDDSQECFKRPKTRVAHGVKIGLRSAPGGLTWEGKEEDMIERLKEQFGKSPAVKRGLITVTEKVGKSEVKKLPASDLANLKAEVSDAGNFVVIAPVETEAEELIAPYLRG